MELLENQVYSLSENEYIKETENAGNADEKKCNAGKVDSRWKKIIDRTFHRLISASGESPIPVCYTVVNSEEFNAAAMPSGKFIIYKGLLNRIEEKSNQGFISIFSSTKEDDDREGHLAAVLSHELAHYFNRHYIKSLKNLIKTTNLKPEGLRMKQLKMSQQDELDADSTGLIYMNRAGYRPQYFLEMLKMIKAETEKAGPKEGIENNIYFSTHPSPLLRLAAFAESDEKILYEFLFGLEKAFADIQLGIELEKAEMTIRQAQKVYKENTLLQKGMAVCLHKMWLADAKPEFLKLKSIIHSPSFQDRLLSDDGTKGSDEIPAQAKYYRAQAAYTKLNKVLDDPYILSNYAALLVYSKDNRKKAVEAAEKTAQSVNVNTQIINNLALVYYIAGEKERSEKLFRETSARLNAFINSSLIVKEKEEGAVRFWYEQIETRKQLDPSYMYEDFTPVLNYSLLLIYEGKKDEGKKSASEFLKRYDYTSEWAKYLHTVSGEKLPDMNSDKNDLKIGGLRPGDTIVKIPNEWGKPSVNQDSRGYQILYFAGKEVQMTVLQGIIMEIHLKTDKSPAVRKESETALLTIGAEKTSAEKILGSRFMEKGGGKFLYSENGKAAVTYQNGRVSEIILFQEEKKK